MPALPEYAYQNAIQSVREMAYQFAAADVWPVMTYEEALALMAPPDVVSTLLAASPVVNWHQPTPAPEIKVATSIGPVGLYLNPSKPRFGQAIWPMKTHPQFDVGSPLHDWVERSHSTINSLRNVVLVLEHLQDNCTSPQALRYIFPGVLQLLHQSGGEQAVMLAGKLADITVPGTLPRLTVEWRAWIRQAQATVASSGLLQVSDIHPPMGARLSANIYT